MSPLEPAWAGLATAAFAVLFNLRPRDAPIAAAIGAIGWAVAAPLAAATGSTPMADLAAATAVGLASEIAAILRRRPASVYIACGIIPLVPGAGMYYTMLRYARGESLEAQAAGLETLGAAAAIAAGIAVSGALARLLSLRRIAARSGLARATGRSGKSPIAPSR